MPLLNAKLGALSSVVTLSLFGCGGSVGGGSDGGQTLHASFSYNQVYAKLWQPNSLPITSTGLNGNSPTCAVTTGSLPSGMSIGSDCAVTGAPSTAGIYPVTVKLTILGFQGSITTQTAINVVGPSTFYAGIGSGSALQAGQTETYSVLGYDLTQNTSSWQAIAGETLTYSVTSGALPPGLTLNASTGQISGAATQTGSFQFTIDATATSGSQVVNAAPANFSVTVSNPSFGATYADFPAGGYTVGQMINEMPAIFYPSGFSTSNATLSFSIDAQSAALPPGLTLDPVTGLLFGTLTGPVPGQNPGPPTPWPYSLIFDTTVTTGGYTFMFSSNVMTMFVTP